MLKSRLYLILAGAGVLPFVACALMPYLGLDQIEPFGRFDRISASYGLAIVSFLAGVHWGTYLYQHAGTPFNLLAISNVVTVVVWIAFLVADSAVALTTLLAAFVVLLLIDLRLFRVGVISGHYLRMRVTVTAVALVSLVATIAAL